MNRRFLKLTGRIMTWMVFIGIAAVIPFDLAQGGNLQIIEKRIRELEKMNQDAIRQTAPVPKEGQVHIKATGRKLHGNLWFGLHHLEITPAPTSYPITIQISSDPDQAKSLEVARQLRRLGVPAYTAQAAVAEKGLWHRIFVGYYPTKEDAGTARDAFAKEFADAFLVTMPFAIQVGASNNPVYLEQMTNHLESKDLLLYRVPQPRDPDTMRLLYGAFKTKAEAQPMIRNLRTLGVSASIVER